MPDKKLHELIAVKEGHRAQATATANDLANTFEKKQHHFTGTIKQYIPDGEDAAARTEESRELQTTVPRELAWMRPYQEKAIDAIHFVTEGNRNAVADVVDEDGAVVVTGVSASTLLDIEKILEELRIFCGKIPTLDPAMAFQADPQKGEGVYVSRETERVRTAKTHVPIVLYPHQDKHPAQTQLVVEDRRTGVVRERHWSGMMTVADKGALLDRVERLSRAVKKARARANGVEVATDNPIGAKLMGYVFG